MASEFRKNLSEEVWRSIGFLIALENGDDTKFRYVAKVEQFIRNKDLNGAIIYILKEKLKLYELADKADQEEIQILDILEYLIKHIPIWKKTAEPAEAYYLTHYTHLLEIILSDTNLSVHIGEKTSAATKDIMIANKDAINIDSTTITSTTPSTTIVGRKIDIIIKDDQGQELSLSEFKAKQQRSLLLQQQAKSVRSNKCILFSLLEKGLKKEDFHLQRVVCMDLAGHTGHLYCVERITKDVVITKHVGKIFVPDDLRDIDEYFTTSLKFLYAWKSHLLKQAEAVRKCERALKIAEDLDDLCNGYEETNDTITCQENTPTRPDCISPISNVSSSAATESPVGSGGNTPISGSTSPPSNRKRKRQEYPHTHFRLNWAKKKENNTI